VHVRADSAKRRLIGHATNGPTRPGPAQARTSLLRLSDLGPDQRLSTRTSIVANLVTFTAIGQWRLFCETSSLVIGLNRQKHRETPDSLSSLWLIRYLRLGKYGGRLAICMSGCSCRAGGGSRRRTPKSLQQSCRNHDNPGGKGCECRARRMGARPTCFGQRGWPTLRPAA
jgi:hypothetical protein